MKTLKINLVSILSVILAIGLMSFKLMTEENMQWYEVLPPNGGVQLIGDPINTPDGESCIINFPAEVCAIQLTGPKPTYLHEAPEGSTTAGRND